MKSENISHTNRRRFAPTGAEVVDSAARDLSPLRCSRSGFSLVELCVGIFLAMVLAGFAVVNINGIMPGLKTNESLAQTMAQFRKGRETALARRREVQLAFLNNNQIQLTVLDAFAGDSVLSTVTLENNVQFLKFNGLPDTPDNFGNTAAVSFGGAAQLRWSTTGILMDNNSNPLSGTVFLGLTGHPETARAVTILGATGRVRAYRWTGSAWIQ